MKNKHCLSSILLVIATALSAAPAGAQQQANIGVAVRRHVEHSKFDELPFGKRDHSLGFTCEFHEEHAFWQLGVSYTPELSRTDAAAHGSLAGDDPPDAPSYAWTPELNLLAKDGIYHGGIGILTTYTNADGGEWSSIYWQFILGIRLDISSKISLSGYGYYPFKRWGNISDFGFSDLEYGIRLGYRY